MKKYFTICKGWLTARGHYLKFFLLIRLLAFKRAPHLFLWNLFWQLFFRLAAILLCLLLTVVPLPLSNMVQGLMNMQLSLDTVSNILDSLRKIFSRLQLFIPSLNDILHFLSPNNLINLLRNISIYVDPMRLAGWLRDLPGDLQRFFASLFSNIRERWRDLKSFFCSLFPLSTAAKRLHQFVRSHLPAVKRLSRSLFQMLGSFVLVKLGMIFLIPLIGLGGAVYLLGYNISFILIGVFTLLTSQAGMMLGRGINRFMMWLWWHWQKTPHITGNRLLMQTVYTAYIRINLFVRRMHLAAADLFERIMILTTLLILFTYFWLRYADEDNINIKEEK